MCEAERIVENMTMNNFVFVLDLRFMLKQVEYVMSLTGNSICAR